MHISSNKIFASIAFALLISAAGYAMSIIARQAIEEHKWKHTGNMKGIVIFCRNDDSEDKSLHLIGRVFFDPLEANGYNKKYECVPIFR